MAGDIGGTFGLANAQDAQRERARQLAQQTVLDVQAERAAQQAGGAQQPADNGLDATQLSEEALQRSGADKPGFDANEFNVASLKSALRKMVAQKFDEKPPAQKAGGGGGEGQEKIKVEFQPLSREDDILQAGTPMAQFNVTKEKQEQPASGGGGEEAGQAGASQSAAQAGAQPTQGGAAQGQQQDGMKAAEIEPGQMENLRKMQDSGAASLSGGSGMGLVNAQTGETLPIPEQGGELKADKMVRMAYVAPQKELEGDGSLLLAFQNMDRGDEARLSFGDTRIHKDELISKQSDYLRQNPQDPDNPSRRNFIMRLRNQAQPDS